MLDPKTLGTAFDFWALGFAPLGSFLLLSLHVFCSCHHAGPKSPRNSLQFLGPWLRFFGELFVAVSAFFLGRVHGGAQIVPEKNRESFPLSKNVFWCCLRMLLLAEYWGVLQEQLQTTIQG